MRQPNCFCGRILNNNGSYEYQYYIKDHTPRRTCLGNVRIVCNSSAVIQSEQHYYPFGERTRSSHTKWLVGEVKRSFRPGAKRGAISGVKTLCATAKVLLRKNMEGNFTATGYNQKYRYNGKELYGALGWYDYGARYYDPAIGRFTRVDPAGELYSSWNPYHYVYNNPLNFIDPTGAIIEDPDEIVKNHKKFLNTNISSLQEFIDNGMVASDIGNKLIGVNKSILKDINNLEKSDQVYSVFNSGDSKEGGVQFNLSTRNIDIGVGSGGSNFNGLVAHELDHASQYERGEISIVTNNSDYGALYDITDETKAFNQERILGMGITYFSDPGAKFTDKDVGNFGKKMNPPAYQTLPNGPININSDAGKKIRQSVFNSGRNRNGVNEVYKGWQKDYLIGLASSLFF